MSTAQGGTPTGVQGITEADIADYLATSPGFFERHAELLGSVQLTSPHGHRAVSLQERQMEMMRDKVKGLERKIIEMIRNGQDNVAISDKLHRWTRALMLTANAADLPGALLLQLMHEFQIPQAALRVWDVAEAFGSLPFTREVGSDVKIFASSLPVPYCGANSGFEASQWLDDPTKVESLAMIPLRKPGEAAPAFGLLLLASPDPTRYTAEMGTEFLERIGEVSSAALSRLLPVG